MRAPRWQLLLAYAAIWFVWGGSYLAIRTAVETLPPSLAMGPRNIIGGVVLTTCAIAFRAAPLDRRQLRAAVIVGLIYFTGSHGLLASAQRHVPSGVAALLFALVPLWIVLIDWAIGRQGPRWNTALGLALGIVGVGVLMGGRGAVGGVDAFWGPLAALAGVAWASGSVIAARRLGGTNPVRSAGMQLLAGGIGLTAYGLVSGEISAFDPGQVSLRSLLGFAYLLIAGTFVSFVAFNWLMAREPASRVATYAFVNPAVAVLLGWAFAGEAINAAVLGAMTLIVAAVALIVLVRR